MKRRLQRQWVTGKVYTVEGRAKRTRRLKLIGRMKVDNKEVLLFRPQRRAAKRRARP
jgi:hypothetical protein